MTVRERTHRLTTAPRALVVLAALFAAVLALGASGAVFAHAAIPAHAKLANADPAPNAILKTAPTTITLKFQEDMKPDGSDIVVYDQKGAKVSTGAATIAASDLKTMKVNMKANDSETYVVVWHNVSADDGDPLAGSYSFTVSADATPSAGQQPSDTTPTTTTPSSSSSGVSPLVATLLGILGLVVGAAGGFFFARSRPAPKM